MNSLGQLISDIEAIHVRLQASAASAVNQALTVRNWLIGRHLVEFEQGGADRAKYGTNLMEAVAGRLSHIKGLTAPELSRCRQFYLAYPHILGSVPQQFKAVLPDSILGSATQESHMAHNQSDAANVPADKLITKLSYTHFTELIKVEEGLKRTFYEIECIKGTWSVRELKRQIASLYFERSGMSARPQELSALVHERTAPQTAKDIIKNIYAFEFLGIPAKDAVEESDLESALLDNFQQLILEMGHGFCLEARQKRILIGETHYFIDLLFYHRILRCHVIVELKVGAFDHADIGQLNTYLNYFKAEVSAPTDNQPVGILLVAEKDHALVRYATAGMDENLFVQRYMLNLPSTDELQRHMERELRSLL